MNMGIETEKKDDGQVKGRICYQESFQELEGDSGKMKGQAWLEELTEAKGQGKKLDAPLRKKKLMQHYMKFKPDEECAKSHIKQYEAKNLMCSISLERSSDCRLFARIETGRQFGTREQLFIVNNKTDYTNWTVSSEWKQIMICSHCLP